MSDADDVATVNDVNTIFVHREEMIEDNNHEKKEKEKRMRIEKKDCKHLDKDECEQYHHSGCYWKRSENMYIIDGADKPKLIVDFLVDSDISDEFDDEEIGSSSKSSKYHRHRVRHRKRVRQRKRQRHRHRVRSRKRSRQRHRHRERKRSRKRRRRKRHDCIQTGEHCTFDTQCCESEDVCATALFPWYHGVSHLCAKVPSQ